MSNITGLYCETVIKTKGKLLVPDALKDEDWCENPDIKLGMISYLGFPLTWPDGECFGTICVLDLKENSYGNTYEELMLQFKELVDSHPGLIFYNEHLKDLVRKRTEELEKANEQLRQEITEHKKTEEHLQKNQANLAEAQRISHLGSWDLNLVSNESEWSDEVYRIFGCTPPSFLVVIPK